MTALNHSDYSFFFFSSPSPFSVFFSFVSPLITAVGSGVGVQMGCRSTPLPFLSLTPSPLLLPTRLSDALTLPGNKLPVKPTCLRCHSIIYLSHWDLFKCGKWFAEALVGKGREMMIAFSERRWQAAACSLLGEGAMCKAGGEWIFPDSSSLPGSWMGVCFTVGFQCRTQLLSTFGRHWLCYNSTGKVFQLGYAVQAAHKYFQTGKYSSVVISHLH